MEYSVFYSCHPHLRRLGTIWRPSFSLPNQDRVLLLYFGVKLQAHEVSYENLRKQGSSTRLSLICSLPKQSDQTMASLHPTGHTAATLISIARITSAVISFTSPSTFAKVLGLGPATSKNAFIPLFGARNMALDLIILIFIWQRRMELVGLVTLCTVPVGIADAVVTWRWGEPQKAWVHILGTCGLALLGMSLANGGDF